MEVEWKEQVDKNKNAAKSSAKKVKAERTKYYRQFGGLEGKTDEEWTIQIKKERKEPNFEPAGWITRDPFYLGMCKMRIRHFCVWIAKYSVVEPWYDPPR